MPAYVIAQVDVSNPDGYSEYTKRVPDVIKQYGGTIRARGGKTEVLEGKAPPSRVVLIEFPTFDHARQFWNSPEYKKVKSYREGHARLDVFILEGA